MKFQFEKLGPLSKKTEIELGDLTILCGLNNTGKTYATRAIYGFFKTWQNHIDFKIDDKQIQSLFEHGVLKIDLTVYETQIPFVLEDLSRKYTASLPTLFNTDEDFFAKTVFLAQLTGKKPNYQREIQLSLGSQAKDVLKIFKDENHHILEIVLLVEDKNFIPHASVVKNFINQGLGQAFFGDYFATPFLITSERIGITHFHHQLKTHQNSHLPIYAHAIADDINFVRDIVDIYSKRKSPLMKEQPELLKQLKAILGGKYKVKNDQIYFSFKNGQKPCKIPLSQSSATVASQVELYFYLKCLAKKGDILLIDEPEQNLHPANQRKMARLLVRLMKAGIKIFIITQSDYILKEFNNLIVLSHPFDDREEVMTKYHYTEEDVLDRLKVKVYAAEKSTLIGADIDEMGMEVVSFDKEIDEMNHIYDDALFSIG
jgi:predicted ATPase